AETPSFFRSSFPFSSSAAYAAGLSVFTTTTRTTVDFWAMAEADSPSINTNPTKANVIFLSTVIPLSIGQFVKDSKRATAYQSDARHPGGTTLCSSRPLAHLFCAPLYRVESFRQA